MKLRRLLVWIVIGQTTLFAQTNSVPATVDPTEAITRLREGLIDSFNKADLERLLSHLDTNVVVTWQNGEVSLGRESVRNYYNKMMRGDRPIVREVKASPEVVGRHVYDDWAVSWGKMNDVFHLTDGSELSFNSLFTATIARRGEQWQVTAFHVSVNAFANAVLQTALKKVGTIIAIVASIGGVIIGFFLTRIFSRKPDAPDSGN